MSVAHVSGMSGGSALRARKAARKGARNASRSRDGGRLKPGRVLVLGFWVLVAAAFFAGASVVLLYGFRWLTTDDFFALNSIEVRGVERLTVDEVTGLTGVALGDNVLDLSVDEVERRLAADPWIASAAVKRILPGGLRIVVRERRAAWWLMDDTGLRYADAQGRPIAPVEADRFESRPQLMAEHGADPSQALERAKDLERAGLPLPVDEAAWVRLLPGGVMEMAFDHLGLTLRVDPDGVGWDESLARLALAWKDLERRKETATLRRLSVAGGKVWAKLARH